MKRTKAQRMLAAACGPVLGVLLAVPVGGLLAGAAGADSCYTGCQTQTTGITTTPAASDGTATAASTSSSNSAPVSAKRSCNSP